MGDSRLIKENWSEMNEMSALTPHTGRQRALARIAALALGCMLALLLLPSGARAAVEIQDFVTSFNEPGPPTPYKEWGPLGPPITQAGAHADFATVLEIAATAPHPQGVIPPEQFKDVVVDMPIGFYGNPRNFPQCTVAEFAGNGICDIEAQVGLVEVHMGVNYKTNSNHFQPAALFNMKPAPGETAALQFSFAGSPIRISLNARRDGSGGLRATVKNASQYLPIYGSTIRIWGVPADPAHDYERYFSSEGLPGAPSPAPPVPFVTMPPHCDGPLVSTVRIRSWQDQDNWTTSSSQMPALTGCENLDFQASLDAQPTETAPDVPSAYEIDVTVPQTNSVDELGTPHLKRAEVTLPEGVSISPSAADGLEACTDEQLELDSEADPSCPDASKIGTVSVETPVLNDPLGGDVYVGSQTPGQRYRIFMVIRGPGGLLFKLPGAISADPQTGRLTTVFDNSPQLPFINLELRFKGGPRAPLANPATCGTKTTTATLTPWEGQAVTSTSSFTIDCAGIGGFAPTLSAGSAGTLGGTFSPFALRIDRRDGEQYLSGVSLKMPPGLLAKTAGVPLCPEAQAAAGTCGAESRIGTATVGAGPGSSPFFLQGSVSLTGPYKGAPYGLSVAVRAIAGPYDLGTVVVRQALHIDPVDARVTAVSDPLPTILEGVPLRLRSVNVDIDRPGFMTTPTSCAVKSVDGSLTSTAGTMAGVSSRFQVGSCSALAFKPKLAMRLVGKGQRFRYGHPGLRAIVTQPAGHANLRSMRVALPQVLALDGKRVADPARLCSYEDGLKAACSAGSVIGRATASTPLLAKPLSGPVHLVQGIRFDKKTGARIRTTPALLVKLRGEIAIDLRARTTVSKDALVTTFPTIPDAPISKFRMDLASGKKGILVNSRRGLCGRAQLAEVESKGQNGKRRDYAAKMATPCPKKAKKKRRK